MSQVEFIESYYYNVLYYFLLLFFAWVTVLYHIGSNGQKILHEENNNSISQLSAVMLIAFYIYYIGLRPVSSSFGDMPLYAMNYEHTTIEHAYYPISLHTEWLWDNFTVFCAHMGLNVNEYFFLIALIYYGSMFFCAWYLTRHNLWLTVMFFMTAFSTYSYGTNGIRNGLACSVVLVAICLLIGEGRGKKIVSFILMFLALGIHRSTMLPSASALATLYVIKDTKWAFRFWLISVALSLLLGNAAAEFFAALGFDDRLERYYEGQYYEGNSERFSSAGFRWDFWLYSAAPVVMIWYVTRFRRFTDIGYTMIANTYLLCNAFWVIVIRSSFSNRFAYLSWFIYPLVILYPLLRMNLWKDQDRKTAIIFFFYSAFLFFMYFIYYFGTTGFRGFDLYWWRKA